MPTADYSSYHQPSGTGADGTKLDNFIDAVQATVNALDKNNLAAAAGILASQLADPTAGKVLGSASSACAAVFPPGYELGYTEFTAPVTVSSTTEATPTDVVSAGAITFDGTRVCCEFYAPAIEPATAAAATVLLNLFEGATNLGRLVVVENGPVGGPVATPCLVRRFFTPSAGAHTYKVSGWEASGSGLVFAGAGGSAAYMPGYIRFTKA